MKKTILLLAFASCSLLTFAQIPNASFENWTGGNPDSWSTGIPPANLGITQSNQAHAGSSAAKISVYSASGTPVSGFLETDYPSTTTTQSDSLTGWYKCNLVNGDQFVVTLILYQNGNNNAFTFQFYNTNQSSYTRFAIAAYPYIVSGVDSVAINFLINNTSTNPDLNSYAIVDELHLGSSASGIHEQQAMQDLAVYPNPATSFIHFNVKDPSVLELYSAEGKLLLSRNVNPGEAQLDISALPEEVLLLVIRNEKQLLRQEVVHTR